MLYKTQPQRRRYPATPSTNAKAKKKQKTEKMQNHVKEKGELKHNRKREQRTE